MTTLELATGNYLKPNGLGGYIISASSLSAWARCQLQKWYYDRARNDPDAPQPAGLSATVYGNVVHYALQIMEKAVHEGREDALQLGVKTFEYYWEPQNTALLEGVDRITDWLPRQSYGGLRERGRTCIRDYYDLLRKDESWLLALEYPFAVPLEIDGRTHTLHGFIDRLAIKKYYSKPYISADDFKTGRQPTYLRWSQQGSVYSVASTLKEFWYGWPESGVRELPHFEDEQIQRFEEMFASYGYRLHFDSPRPELPLASRRFRWINMQEIKFADGGWRNARDAARLKLAINGYIRGAEAEAYGVTMDGNACPYCPFKKVCGGVGLPDIDEGKP